MALLFMDGFDAGDYASKWTSYNTTLPVNTNTRWGTGRSIHMFTSGAALFKSFAASSQVFVGMAYCYQTSQTLSSGSYAVSLYGDNNVTQHLSVCFGSAGVALYRGSTQIATNNTVIEPINYAWLYLEIGATIADAGGTCIVRINGVEVINFTGDTKNAGTSSTIDAIRLIRTGGTSLYDDVYICDGTGANLNGFLGDVRVQTLSPNGAGSSAQFAPTGSANNWDNVDEAPYSTAEFNSSSTSGHRDLYALADLAATTTTVHAIQNNVIAKKSDAGARSIRTVVKSAATVATGTATALGSTDATVSTLRPTDPATGAAWTVAAVNALEAGVEVV